MQCQQTDTDDDINYKFCLACKSPGSFWRTICSKTALVLLTLARQQHSERLIACTQNSHSTSSFIQLVQRPTNQVCIIWPAVYAFTVSLNKAGDGLQEGKATNEEGLATGEYQALQKIMQEHRKVNPHPAGDF